MSDEEDIDESFEIEEDGISITDARGNSLKAQQIAGKERNLDPEADDLEVVVNFYEAGDGTFQLQLPKLTAVKPVDKVNDVLDFINFDKKVCDGIHSSIKLVSQRDQTGPAPFPKHKLTCAHCDWSFDNVMKLVRHRGVHKNVGVYMCQVCLTLFGHTYNLFMHWRTSCSQTSTTATDIEIQKAETPYLHRNVLNVLGSLNRASQYYCTGGYVFLPSDWCITNKEIVMEKDHMSSCHLCHLPVPNKFLEAHGNVHRGRFRIDGRIYGDYFCHICGTVFIEQDNLFKHWRLHCEEVIAYTPVDQYLSNTELATLAWLVLQTTISQADIECLRVSSSLITEKLAKEHAERHGIANSMHKYYHFPQEIWPLKTFVNLDLVNDAIPISGENSFKIKDPKRPVHIMNLLATACPGFYATGKTFNMICSTKKSESDTKKVYRVILRYTTEGSVIQSYDFTARSFPKLRVDSETPEGVFSHPLADFNVESNEAIVCHKCDSKKLTITFSTEVRLKYHLLRHSESRKDGYHCAICKIIVYNRSHEEHWINDCIPLQKLYRDQKDRECFDAEFAAKCASIIKKLRIRTLIRWKERANEDWVETKQTPDRIGEDFAIKFQVGTTALKTLMAGLEEHYKNAQARHEAYKYSEENFLPPLSTPVVVCFHCGTRCHYTLLHDHLDYCHYWPRNKRLVNEEFHKWKKNGCRNTWRVMKSVAEAMQIEVPFISEEQYSKILDYHTYFCNDTRYKVQDSINNWNDCSTIRDVDLSEKLSVAEIVQKGEDSVMAPEPDIIKNVYFPSARIITDNMLLRMTEINLNDVVQRDPITKEELTGKFKEVQDEQDAILFGDYRAVLRSKGIMVNSISDFVAPPDELAKAKASQESAGQESVDHRNRREREFIQQYMGKDLALEAAARENGRLVEVDEEAEDYELTPKELNARRLVERNRHREMCKTRCEHGEYDYEKFKARQVPINPAKMKERKYLTRVVHESGPDDDVCPDEPENNIIAFSPKYENSLSDFRISAIGFREKYLADDKKKRNGIPIRKMTEAQKGVALDYDTLMARHGGRPDVIMNPAGTVFVGGFVFDRKPTCQDNMQTVYVLRNGYAHRYRIYHCEDTNGIYKFVWPQEQSFDPDSLAKSARVRMVKQVKSPEHMIHHIEEIDESIGHNYRLNRKRRNSETREHELIELDTDDLNEPSTSDGRYSFGHHGYR
ncbi:Zinc finger protein sdc-1 [Caenorhabditis elegans]|uniref:Zinc finger protein sdc-1 n=1 Tax=Caenorhabditis elegans TaxID=6239 RepID=SDC1_CAEEL|nr:Zinc finger protein sdc-1 [Caenorhabditis elegans]P24349.2 RecName: Full=Zinc finger protein sdc-1; AltName: Full=Egg-laying defective protein 16 [Caenorhabditis elegans]CAA91056.2 Zinc finger protein sdc-1 [Caenorhabditis elegans]|eukprot:NP_510650.2 Zinc finger protein sdc-1 [Caenorhabditis elegans]